MDQYANEEEGAHPLPEPFPVLFEAPMGVAGLEPRNRIASIAHPSDHRDVQPNFLPTYSRAGRPPTTDGTGNGYSVPPDIAGEPGSSRRESADSQSVFHCCPNQIRIQIDCMGRGPARVQVNSSASARTVGTQTPPTLLVGAVHPVQPVAGENRNVQEPPSAANQESSDEPQEPDASPPPLLSTPRPPQAHLAYRPSTSNVARLSDHRASQQQALMAGSAPSPTCCLATAPVAVAAADTPVAGAGGGGHGGAAAAAAAVAAVVNPFVAPASPAFPIATCVPVADLAGASLGTASADVSVGPIINSQPPQAQFGSVPQRRRSRSWPPGIWSGDNAPPLYSRCDRDLRSQQRLEAESPVAPFANARMQIPASPTRPCIRLLCDQHMRHVQSVPETGNAGDAGGHRSLAEAAEGATVQSMRDSLVTLERPDQSPGSSRIPSSSSSSAHTVPSFAGAAATADDEPATEDDSDLGLGDDETEFAAIGGGVLTLDPPVQTPAPNASGSTMDSGIASLEMPIIPDHWENVSVTASEENPGTYSSERTFGTFSQRFE